MAVSSTKNQFDLFAQEPVKPSISFRKMRADDLGIDKYQRILRLNVVNRIAKNFDPSLFGVITLSERADGSLKILDGQHRVAAVVKMGAGDTLLPCEVITGKSYEEESHIFYRRNRDRTPMSAQDKFRGAMEAGEDRAPEIRKIVEGAGFSLNLDSAERTGGRICGVGSLNNIDKNYAEGHLSEALQLIADTWGTDMGPRGSMIQGVSIFTSFYRDYWDRKRFISQMRKVGMEAIHTDAAAYRKATGVSPARSVSAVIVRNYNARLREDNQLPSMEEMRAINMLKEAGHGN